MKIAITADLHLTSREKHPQRYHALTSILDQLLTRSIHHLVIAGDLFDASCKNPGELEAFLSKPEYAPLSVYVIPGNHDPVLSAGAFTLPNLHYITGPRLIPLAGGMPFLFLPYQPETSIGESLAAFPEQLPANNWVLVTHGDYLAGTRLRNEYESGLYMPLSGRDLQLYQPKKVFLGHIHAPLDTDLVHYPGSPCPLDPAETGLRSFLIYDTASSLVERLPVENGVIYFQETLSVIPLADEAGYIRELLANRIAAWGLDESLNHKVQLRLSLQGYSGSRENLLSAIMEVVEQHHLALQQPPDLSKVLLSTDVLRGDIAAAVQDQINGLDLPEGPDEVTRDELVLASLNTIYGGAA